MKKILLSLMTIALVGGVAFGATKAFFSDTETSTGNTFSAGTIDIAVNGENYWQETNKFTIADMKPGQTEYTNFTINNVGTNPVNIFKKVDITKTEGGKISEPECGAQGGTWNNGQCEGGEEQSNIDSVLKYDLSIKVFNSQNTEIFSQVLYNKDITLSEIKGKNMFLGMIPVGGRMEVTESYQMDEATDNWAQGDQMTFGITLTGEQLKGVLSLEDKDPSNWDINQASTPAATLTYGVRDSKFKYTLSGVAPLSNTQYSLIAYLEPWSTPSGNGWPRPVIVLGSTTSGSNGEINLNGEVELDKSLLTMKIWLVKTADLSGNTLNGWNPTAYLFETGLIDYYDADLP